MDGKIEMEAACVDFYRHAVSLMQENKIPFLLGGAYALGVHTGITRHTKDLDFFIRESELDRALEIFEKNGYRTERSFPHWLAKAFCGDYFVDFIYAAGNGLCKVTSRWFDRAQAGEFLGMRIEVMAPEEIIWMKAFVQERERFDGADIAHLLRSCDIDWEIMRAHFREDWRVLYAFLILFGYIYPSERQRLPAELLREYGEKFAREQAETTNERVCRGTLLSRAQFLPDLEQFGYRDPRLDARTTMDEEDVAHWTAAIENKDRAHLATE